MQTAIPANKIKQSLELQTRTKGNNPARGISAFDVIGLSWLFLEEVF